MTTIRIYNNFNEIYEFTIPTINQDIAIIMAKRKFEYCAYGSEEILKIEVVN